MACSYLTERKITVNYARETVTKSTNKGCVQGSICGPTFWNIIIDSLLQRLTDAKVHCQAFADDVVLAFSSESSSTIENAANEAMKIVTKWGSENKLNFAPQKTQAMVLTKKLKFQNPTIQMAGSQINLVEEIKVLGLIIDTRLNFRSHVAAVCKKSIEIYKRLACSAKVTWGLNSEIIRIIYTAVIEPIMMYASNTWAPATELEMIRSALSSLQRGFAIKICRAYRTVSLTSAMILAGLLPLDLRIREAEALYKAKRIIDGLSSTRKELEKDIANTERPHPAKAMSIEYELVDESDPDPLEKLPARKSTRTAAKLTEGSEQRSPVAMVKASREKVVNILSDSRSSLELLSNPRAGHPLAHAIRESTRNAKAEEKEIRFYWLRAHVGTKGNERADELAKIAAQKADADYDYEKIPLSWTGAITKTFFPDAKKAYATIRKLKPTPVQTQIFTGHTGIAEYLHRFKLLQSPSCECDADKIESVWHIILECPRESLPEATSRHRSMNRKRNEETPPTAPTSAPTQNPKRIPKTKLQHCARRQRKECYVAQKQQESLGYEQGEWHCSWTKTRKG
ncbi:Putative 115 kDa protein in type-1 retrotransposable element R1DM [Eumeta japonica]|uniref:115 kDa protein in type-1 retrotransposable element R1DM n=1 Tax=Eumeta variegata TaxID=151549 RepID=A0A4C2A899_EUMVA|nr:Putative 115 kDa protein in type-1 retrotransposable element R1DM [Eumeta japonica]